MLKPGRQVQARSRRERVLRPVDVRHALTRHDQHYLVVRMTVIGSSSGRDLADKLGRHRAAATRSE